jgi:hypothetical protein
MGMTDLSRRRLLRLGALGAAGSVWLPDLHRVCTPRDAEAATPGAVAPHAMRLFVRQERRWRDPSLWARDFGAMRRTCAEWDLMARTFTVLAAVNMALRDPGLAPRARALVDGILDDTRDAEGRHGFAHFLLPYGHRGGWREAPASSVFVDGEVALMLAARRTLGDTPTLREALAARLDRFVPRMRASPLRSAESYPDECWTFCNTVALAATRLADALDGSSHADLRAAWCALARRRLVDPATGMLVSSYTLDGRVGDGPEASSLFMAAHDLLVVDPALARDQYRRARRAFGRTVLGFGYAREWPDATGRDDVDSGPTVPGVGANAGASGLAVLGAAAFGDRVYLRALLASLHLAAFPTRGDDGGLAYAASNPVGDAVVLYALTLGPLWQRLGGAA